LFTDGFKVEGRKRVQYCVESIEGMQRVKVNVLQPCNLFCYMRNQSWEKLKMDD
jgi:hypothetical protein